MSKASSDLIQQFAALPTAAVSDALDFHRLPGSAHGIGPLFNEARLCGRVFTVKYSPKGFPGGTAGDFLDEVPEGAIIAVDNDARTDCTVWGDIMTTLSLARGVGGTVISGVCRDVSLAIERSYPIFSCGRFMRTGKDRVELAAIGQPVNIGGVRVCPGDVAVGDANGVVFVPAGVAEKVLMVARRIEDAEAAILGDLERGISLLEARKRHHYHTLQTPKDEER